jgi:hypothetical protein
LSNPLHAGLIGFKGELLQGRHHEIRYYDRDVYERILETKRTRTCWSTDRKTGELHLLAGIVTCARCGKRLYMAQASGYASYRCVTGHAQGRRTCPDVRVQCSWIEPAVVEAIARLSQSPEILDILESEASLALDAEDRELRDEEKQLQTSLAGIAAQFERLTAMRMRDQVSDAEFDEFAAKLRQERAGTDQKLNAVRSRLAAREVRAAEAEKVRAAVREFYPMWQNLRPDEQRQVLSDMLERLTVDRTGTEVTLTVKVRLLPEVIIPVTAPHAYAKRAVHDGVRGLTGRQLALLFHILQGRTLAEAAEALGLALSSARVMSWKIVRKTGASSIETAAQLAHGRVNAMLPKLRTGQYKGTKATKSIEDKLTPNLREVFPLLASGARPREISASARLTLCQAQGRKRDLLKAFEVNSVFDMVRKARELGIYDELMG